jgi:5-methylthioribose kinase
MPEDNPKSGFGTDTTSPQKSGSPEAPQYVLPKNIANSVRHLSDGDLDLLFRACAKESKRRGAKMTSVAEPPVRPVGATPVPLTRAQVGAVQAAFKAGVKPAAIARQFRLSHAQVREALSSQAR